MEKIKKGIDISSLDCNKQLLEDWLDTEMAAKFFEIDTSTLLNMISNDRSFPYYKLGKRNRYLASELDAYIRKNPRGERPWE